MASACGRRPSSRVALSLAATFSASSRVKVAPLRGTRKAPQNSQLASGLRPQALGAFALKTVEDVQNQTLEILERLLLRVAGRADVGVIERRHVSVAVLNDGDGDGPQELVRLWLKRLDDRQLVGRAVFQPRDALRKLSHLGLQGSRRCRHKTSGAQWRDSFAP